MGTKLGVNSLSYVTLELIGARSYMFYKAGHLRGYGMAGDSLGNFEFDVLAVLMRQPTNSYGTTIRERIEEKTGRRPSVGALYTTLDRLEAKGFVRSWWGEATAERGGRKKRFFEIKASGQNAVRATDMRRKSWGDFGGMAPVGG